MSSPFDIAQKYLSKATPTVEIRKTDDGAILARRLDGEPLTLEDRQQAKRITAIEQAPVSDPAVLIDDDVVAVLIDSTVLGAPIWFAFCDGWKPEEANGIPVCYASELPALRMKTPEQLRDIFQVKRVFGGGMVRQ